MLITGCGSRAMGCCGGMARCGTLGLGAVGPELPCNTRTGRPFAVRLVIFEVALRAVVLWARSCTHVCWDRTQF
jgi:hypothetical protein